MSLFFVWAIPFGIMHQEAAIGSSSIWLFIGCIKGGEVESTDNTIHLETVVSALEKKVYCTLK